MILKELRLGPVRDLVDGRGRPWRSAIAKTPVAGPVPLGAEGLAGDDVCDRHHHGGPDQALLAYAHSHYAAWTAEGTRLEPGAFGENLVVEGANDQDTCVGDVWNIGGLRLQVSHPRIPCATLTRHLGDESVGNRVWAAGRGGWYLRVLQAGMLDTGPIELMDRPHPGWTIARVLEAFHRAASAPEEALAASRLSHLTQQWRDKLALKAGG